MTTVNSYRIEYKGDDFSFSAVIPAKTPASAWRKFSTQRFGILKPSRKDYTIAKVN